MAEKKYYWLKLKKDFFKRHDIRIIEEMPNGKDYILFYLKLLLESINHEGMLRFSDTIPYNEQMLSVITNTNIDIVRAAMKIFRELNMIDVLEDSTIFIDEVTKMIGSETSAAARMRKSRERNNVTQKRNIVQNSYTEIEIEKDLEKDLDLDKEIEKERIDYASIMELYNSTCPSLPSIKSLSNARIKTIKARLKKYTLDDIKLLFEKAEASDFLKGSNNRDWNANFDWLLKDANIAKVIDGNYDNKESKSSLDLIPTDCNTKDIGEMLRERAKRRIEELDKNTAVGNPDIAKNVQEVKKKLQGKVE